MTTPAESIPVANAVPVPPTPSAPTDADLSKKDDDYFQLLGGTQYLRRFVRVYVGHLDTFITITLVACLPAVIGYQWMLRGHFGSYYIFYYLLLPFTRLLANGAAVHATALIYTLGDDRHIPWKQAIQVACQRQVWNRWLVQFLYTKTNWFLAPLGIFAFSPQLLLLTTPATTSLVGVLTTSGTMVFRRPGTFVATIFFTFLWTPFLCWVLEQVVGLLLPFVWANSSGTEEGDDVDPDQQQQQQKVDEWAQGRQQVQEMIALPLVSCLWTILYLNICIQKGLRRPALAQELGVQLQPAVVARIH